MKKRGYFGIGIFNGKTEENLGTLYRSAFNLGADFVYTVGKRYKRTCSDTAKAYKNIPMFHFENYDDFMKHIPFDCMLVAVELNDDSVNLKNFTHPERAVYILGAEDHGIPPRVLEKCKHIIEIDSNHCMNVAVTGAIVMYDREVKRG